MSNCLFSELYRNEFRVSFSITIDGILYQSTNLNTPRGGIKIDTGASSTLIPLRTLGLSPSKIEGFKYAMLQSGQIGGIVRGVESSNSLISMDDVRCMDIDSQMELTCLKFFLPNVTIQVGTISLTLPKIAVTTDTTGNLLLGMDVLGQFDYHGGISVVTNHSVLIACPANDISEEYTTLLQKHFPNLNANGEFE